MKLGVSFLFSCFAIVASAQVDMGVPVATGMGGAGTTLLKDWEAVGVNPANLGFKKTKRLSVGALNYGLSIQSTALDLENLSTAFFDTKKSFGTEAKQKFIQLFSADGGIKSNFNINWLAASVKIPKIGGFAINVRDRISFSTQLNSQLTDVLFNGTNSNIFSGALPTSAELFDGSTTEYLHYRELNFAYGTKIAELGKKDDKGKKKIDLFAGIGYKILWGIGNTNIAAANGNFTARSAYSKSFDINYGVVNNYQLENASNLFNSAGIGAAWDFGATLVFDKSIKFAASIIDLGSINWKRNVLEASNDTINTLLPTEDGISNFDLSNQTDLLYGSNGILNFKEAGDYKTQLNSKLRLGTGIALSKNLEIAYDIVFPLNELNTNLKTSYFAIGGQYKLLDLVTISSGYSGNETYGYSVPFGLKFATFGITEFSVATNDILTYLRNDRNTHFSLAVGVLRFNIP